MYKIVPIVCDSNLKCYDSLNFISSLRSILFLLVVVSLVLIREA